MARKKQVKVKTYQRKDGTVVRSSSRSVLTVGDKNINKRQNTLGGHIRKGATILGALGGASGVLGGAVVGGVVGGPIGAGVGAVSYGTSGAFGGGISGAGYGAGTYYLKKKLAKDKSKRNFDYKRNLYLYEFARPFGSKDKKPRQRKGTTLLVNRGLSKNEKRAVRIVAGTGLAIAGARLYKNRKGLNLKKATQNAYKGLVKTPKNPINRSILKNSARNIGKSQVINTAYRSTMTPLLAANAGIAGIDIASRLRQRKEQNKR